MFIENQQESKRDYYKKMLQTAGALSKLFSDSEMPYLYYRVAENLFCKSFGAENLSRSDTSADASSDGIGFGLKTFLQGSGKKMEKIAEFNSDSHQFRDLSHTEQVLEIARLRNERIQVTKNIYRLDSIIYHCICRSKGKMSIIETPMHPIDISSIKIKKSDKKTITFLDKYEEYSFNISKSTLFKRFTVKSVLLEVTVEIIDDPFTALESLFPSKSDRAELVFPKFYSKREHVFLPLYSTQGLREQKKVPTNSGLNQWNAEGRKRKINEVYIPIPAWIHRKFKGFFPPRDDVFNLLLPNKMNLSASVCQQGSKALMSNPNDALGKWILRDVLNLKEGELLNYKKLEDIGLDTVVVYKNKDASFSIDFAKIGSYDSFEEEYDI